MLLQEQLNQHQPMHSSPFHHLRLTTPLPYPPPKPSSGNPCPPHLPQPPSILLPGFLSTFPRSLPNLPLCTHPLATQTCPLFQPIPVSPAQAQLSKALTLLISRRQSHTLTQCTPPHHTNITMGILRYLTQLLIPRCAFLPAGLQRGRVRLPPATLWERWRRCGSACVHLL